MAGDRYLLDPRLSPEERDPEEREELSDLPELAGAGWDRPDPERETDGALGAG